MVNFMNFRETFEFNQNRQFFVLFGDRNCFSTEYRTKSKSELSLDNVFRFLSLPLCPEFLMNNRKRFAASD